MSMYRINKMCFYWRLKVKVKIDIFILLNSNILMVRGECFLKINV